VKSLKEHKKTHGEKYRLVPKSIYDIVQARKSDKETYPDQFEKWTFEVVLVQEDETIEGED